MSLRELPLTFSGPPPPTQTLPPGGALPTTWLRRSWGGQKGTRDGDSVVWLWVPLPTFCPITGCTDLCRDIDLLGPTWEAEDGCPRERGVKLAYCPPALGIAQSWHKKEHQAKKISFSSCPLILGYFPNLPEMNVYHLLRHRRIELYFLQRIFRERENKAWLGLGSVGKQSSWRQCHRLSCCLLDGTAL